MTSNGKPDLPTAERRAAIARLVQRGGMQHAREGQYFNEGVRELSKEQAPQYDVKAIREAFPQLLEIGIGLDPETQEFVAALADGNVQGEPDEFVRIGKELPKDTEGLIEVLRAHFKREIDFEAMGEVDKAFEGF